MGGNLHWGERRAGPGHWIHLDENMVLGIFNEVGSRKHCGCLGDLGSVFKSSNAAGQTRALGQRILK